MHCQHAIQLEHSMVIENPGECFVALFEIIKQNFLNDREAYIVLMKTKLQLDSWSYIRSGPDFMSASRDEGTCNTQDDSCWKSLQTIRKMRKIIVFTFSSVF